MAKLVKATTVDDSPQHVTAFVSAWQRTTVGDATAKREALAEALVLARRGFTYKQVADAAGKKALSHGAQDFYAVARLMAAADGQGLLVETDSGEQQPLEALLQETALTSTTYNLRERLTSFRPILIEAGLARDAKERKGRTPLELATAFVERIGRMLTTAEKGQAKIGQHVVPGFNAREVVRAVLDGRSVRDAGVRLYQTPEADKVIEKPAEKPAEPPAAPEPVIPASSEPQPAEPAARKRGRKAA